METWLGHLGGAAVVGVDTEFERTRTFFPRPALVQLSDGQQELLIDPLAFDPRPGLVQLWRSSGVKVLHSCSEDLDVFRCLTGEVPQPLFDTQLAAAFSGYGFSLGYQKLLAAALGVDIPKDETRSDWLARPLSAAQKRYAALDVRYLVPLYEHLQERLEARGHKAWFNEEMAIQLADAEAGQNPQARYQMVRGAAQLGAPGRRVLRRLAEWRELQARERDVPRGFVLKDPVLMAIAQARPKNLAELAGLQELGGGEVRRFGATLLELVSAAQEETSAEPAPVSGGLLPPSLRSKVKQFKSAVAACAQALDIPQELLARSKEINALVAHRELGEGEMPPRLATGWRKSALESVLPLD